MATRATIAKMEKDGSGIKAIYLHSDGYLGYAGRILNEHYQDESKIDELLAHGDASSLNENIGEKLPFNDYMSFHENKQCRFYARDRGEQHTYFNMCTDELDLIRFANKSCNAEYVYLYAYGYWYVYSVEDNTYEFVELENELYVLK